MDNHEIAKKRTVKRIALEAMAQCGLKKFHVWIARGDTTASADFWALDKTDAKRRASELWGVELHKLAAHPHNDCHCDE